MFCANSMSGMGENSYAMLVVYREYPTRDLIFLCIHPRLKARVYTKTNQLTHGIFTVYHSKALHCIALYCTLLYCTVLHCTLLYSTVLYCAVL